MRVFIRTLINPLLLPAVYVIKTHKHFMEIHIPHKTENHVIMWGQAAVKRKTRSNFRNLFRKGHQN